MAIDATTLNNLLAGITQQNGGSLSGAPDYIGYVKNNPDMMAAFQAGTGYARGRSMEDFGKIVYQQEGGVNDPHAYNPVSGWKNTNATPFVSSDGQSFGSAAELQQHENSLTQQKAAAGLTAAQARAHSQADQAFKMRGLDPTQYGGQIDEQLQQILSGIPQGDTDPAGYFPSNFGDQVAATLENQQRSQYGRQVNSTFNPTYSDTALPNNLLQDQINQILGTQGAQASEGLDRAKARGQINDIGYAGGQSTFGNERTQALSKLNSIASDVLTGYKSKLDNVASSARTAASGATLGDTFNLNDYLTKANTITDQAKTNAGGDLLNQLGGTKLFDLNSILGDAGMAQGAVNLKNKDVADALAAQDKTNTQKRGLGSEGAF